MYLRFSIFAFGVLSIFLSTVAKGQRSPTDLADVPLSELLEMRVQPSSSSADSSTSSNSTVEPLASASPTTLWSRHKHVEFEGYLDGTTELSNQDVLALYPVVPTEIDQDATIIGLDYQFSNLVDLTFSIPYIQQSTYHIRRSGAPFTLDSEGFGDLALATNIALVKSGRSSVILSLGLTAPTGSIDEKGDTPRGKNRQLPYAMQLGSGTWDLHPGVTFATSLGDWQVGANLDGLLRIGENDRGYCLGDELATTIWAKRDLTSRLKFGAYLRGESWAGVNGEDPDVNPNIAPVADADTYGGKKVEVGGSLRFLWKESIYENNFVEIGLGAPLYQDLRGPQPMQRWECTLGISIGF